MAAELIHVLDEIDLATGVENITTGEIGGTGIYDKLMQAAAAQLKEEFDNQRIAGKEYAQVYVGIVSAAMRTAVQFHQLEMQAVKTRNEIALLRQKTVTELASTDDQIPLGLGFNDSQDIEGLVGKQKNLVQAQTDGFSRDAEQKIAKIYSDLLSVFRTTDEGFPIPSSVVEAEFNKVFQKATSGIGVV